MTPVTAPLPLARGDQLALLDDERRARHARPGRRLRLPWRRHAGTAGLIAFAVLAALAPQPAGAAGVARYLSPVCGRGWVPVNLGGGDYFNVYNEPDGLSCVRVQDGRNGNVSWYVSWRGDSLKDWEYPNVSSGIEWGRYTCYDGRSGLKSSPGSRCMRYPVQASRDGFPRTAVSYVPHMASGIADYDIWFNKEDVPPSRLAGFGRDDGAEVMIWLSHPGIPLSNYHILWRARILGRLYYVTGWLAGAGSGRPWLYTAYIAARQTRSLPPTWLNYFFRDAAKHGRLDMGWYLTAIDFGAEINPGRMPGGLENGTGFGVKSYSLTGVR